MKLRPVLLVLVAAGVAVAGVPAVIAAEARIDRHALVTRHNPVIRAFNPDAPLTVGNGNFAFSCDITGLQTFGAQHQQCVDLRRVLDSAPSSDSL